MRQRVVRRRAAAGSANSSRTAALQAMGGVMHFKKLGLISGSACLALASCAPLGDESIGSPGNTGGDAAAASAGGSAGSGGATTGSGATAGGSQAGTGGSFGVGGSGAAGVRRRWSRCLRQRAGRRGAGARRAPARGRHERFDDLGRRRQRSSARGGNPNGTSPRPPSKARPERCPRPPRSAWASIRTPIWTCRVSSNRWHCHSGRSANWARVSGSSSTRCSPRSCRRAARRRIPPIVSAWASSAPPISRATRFWC